MKPAKTLLEESLVHISLLNALSPAAENLHILLCTAPSSARRLLRTFDFQGGWEHGYFQDAPWLVGIQWPVFTHSQAHVFGVVMLVIST